jgi:hypothetical protein
MRIVRREHVGWLTAWLVLAGLMSAVVVLLAPSSAVKTLVSRLRPEASSSESLPVPRRQDTQISPEVRAPSATANPAEVQRPGLPEASSPVRGEHSPADAAGEFPVTGGASETRAAARVAPNPRRAGAAKTERQRHDQPDRQHLTPRRGDDPDHVAPISGLAARGSGRYHGRCVGSW